MSFAFKLLIPILVHGQIVERVDNIYKSVNDAREYRYLELENGLEVALVR